MLSPTIAIAAVASIVVVLGSLAVIDTRMLPAAGWRYSALMTAISTATGVVAWLVIAPLAVPDPGALYPVIAALGGLGSYLATIAVRAAGARLGATLVFGAVWSSAVFVPVALLTFYPASVNWPLAINPIDHGGSLAVNVAAGAAALAVLMTGGAVSRTARVPRGTAILAVIMLCIGWWGWLVFIEMAFDDATPLIVGNGILAAVGGVAGWLVVQRIRHQSTTLDGVGAGLISGLVAVTSGGPLLAPWAATVIGVVAGAVACIFTLRRVLASRRQQWFIVGSHLVAGVIGFVLLGVLAEGMGYFYTGDTGATFTGVFSLLESQEISAVLVTLYSGAVSFGLWSLLRVFRRPERTLAE